MGTIGLNLAFVAPTKANDFVGDWAYNSYDLPYEYQKGNLRFYMEDEALDVEVTVNNSSFKGTNVSVSKDTVSFYVQVDYQSEVKVVLTLENNQLKGYVLVDGQKISLDLKKVV